MLRLGHIEKANVCTLYRRRHIEAECEYISPQKCAGSTKDIHVAAMSFVKFAHVLLGTHTLIHTHIYA